MGTSGASSGSDMAAVAGGPLADQALDRLWDAVAERVQRNGMVVRGTIRLDALNQAERFALAGLLGRPVTESRVRVDLAVLDRRLRASRAAGGLVAAVDQLRGPLVDRRGERAARGVRLEARWAELRAGLACLGLDREPWFQAWDQSIRSLIGPDPSPATGAALLAAGRCLAVLSGAEAESSIRGRAELAAQVVGDSHGLDDDSLAGAMVLRGVALRHGVPNPATAEARRVLWESEGVLCDEVSTTVLCLGLFPPASGARAPSLLAARSAAGWETHLSLRDLRRLDRLVAVGTEVYVCENPRVLEAAMDAGSRSAIVCVSGNPTLVATRLLERLAADGAALRYRGDFDWSGISIANRVVEHFGATPWRMGTADYEAALAAAGRSLVGLPELIGRAVSAVWDADLAPAMERARRVVHEERLLGLLISDLC
jgi:uncharacterized protein (TIGR02679 family)